MKAFYLLLIFLLLNTYAQAQSVQLIKNEFQTTAAPQIFFYDSIPDRAFNEYVKFEFRSLSDFFMLKPRCYFYDSLNVIAEKNIQPDFDAKSIFLNVSLVKAYSETSIASTRIVNLMAHQFAYLILEKYKVDLPAEQKLLLIDFMSGYYIACRYRTLKAKADINFDSLEIDSETNQIDTDIRRLTFSQGGVVFVNNFKRRKTCTLPDLIQTGMDFINEQ